MPDLEEWNMRVTSPMNRVWRHPHGYLEGHVITAHGIVSVYSQGGGHDGIREVPQTTLQMVHEGRLYSRGINKRYSQRGLVTLANRFAEEIADA